MGEEYKSIILLRIKTFRIALPLELCKSVEVFETGEDSGRDMTDITKTRLGFENFHFANYLRLDDDIIISFSTFEGIINLHKNYIEIPQDIFYNKDIYFTCLIYHEDDNEYYALLRYSLSN